jgi:uncharacterized protein with ATP-grasp and redox domains
MKQLPPCHACVERQVLRVLEVSFTCPDAPRMTAAEKTQATQELLAETRQWLAVQSPDLSPAELSFEPIKMVYRKLGLDDPYDDLKHRSNLEALALLPELREWIRTSEKPIETAAKLAVAGNIIDLGIRKDYDIHESIGRLLEHGFIINHIDCLISDLSRKEQIGEESNLLYICDNAGEIAFDRLFIEVLLEYFPSCRIVAAVNSGPVLNDALLVDAEAVGLCELVPVIENGYDLLGTVLDQVSAEFREYYDKADWVISKGQANFETLDGLSEKVLFLLKAKCEPIAEYLNVSLYQGVFKQNQSNYPSLTTLERGVGGG